MIQQLRIRVFIITFCFLGISFNAQKQAFVKSTDYKKSFDTLSYLKTFETNKKEYIGKKFSYLLSKMEKIQPRTVWIVPSSIDTTLIQKSIFRFYDMNYPIMNETKMMITWENGLPYKTVSVNNRRNKFYFSDSETRFYGNRIVKNILVYR